MTLNEDGIEIRKKIGYIGHEIYLYEELTALENLRFFSKLYNIPKNKYDKRIKDLLKSFDLTHRMNDYVRVYSRGMKQRLSIARAILHEPEILLLDEPYTGLDQKARDILDDFLFQTNSKKTIIMTTHNIERLKFSKKIAILSKGKIVHEINSKQINLDEFKKIYSDLEGLK